MESGNIQYVPPIEIHDYEQFIRYARRARMVTFERIYESTPFAADPSSASTRWLTGLVIYAVGVDVDGLVLTLVHTVHFPPPPLDAEEEALAKASANSRLAKLIRKLQTELHAIPGSPALPSLQEQWIKTLR
jgi:cytochrome c-type biogenesis protein CcmH/NrfG